MDKKLDMMQRDVDAARMDESPRSSSIADSIEDQEVCVASFEPSSASGLSLTETIASVVCCV